MTHGPSKLYEPLDATLWGDRAGCPTLSEVITRLKPRLHTFGHIHEAHGAHLWEWKDKAGKLGEY